jgi:hypothetical protein
MIKKSQLVVSVLCIAAVLVIIGWLKDFYGFDTRVHDLLERRFTKVQVQYLQHPNTAQWIDRFENISVWDLILRTSFLRSNLVASGINAANIDRFEKIRRDQQEVLLQRLSLQRGTLPYRALVRGLEDLHGFTGKIEKRLDIPLLLDPVADKYNIHFRDWFSTASGRAGVAFSFKVEEPQFWLEYRQQMDQGILPLHLKVFRPILNMSFAFQGIEQSEHPGIQALIKKEGFTPTNLDEYQQLIQGVFFEGKQRLDIRAVYLNGNIFDDYHIAIPDKQHAEAIFLKRERASSAEKRALKEYLLFWLLRELQEKNLSLILNTVVHGLLDAKQQDYNPKHLQVFLSHYRTVGARVAFLYDTQIFDAELLQMAGNMPSVFFYMFWMPTCDVEVFRTNYTTAISTIPATKILFAGGTINPEQTYGAVRIAKDILLDVLTEKVLDGTYTIDQAVSMAIRFFVGNATGIYQFRPGMDLDLGEDKRIQSVDN